MKNKTKLKYNEYYDVYHCANRTTPVKVTKATEEDVKAYFLEQYERIFPGYDEQRHIVSEKRVGIDAYFTLHEKVEEKDVTNSDFPEPGLLEFIELSSTGISLKPMNQRTLDNHVELRPELNDLEQNVLKFFRMKDQFEQHGLETSRGTLLYGPPGNGKTHAILRMARKCIRELGAYVFIISDELVRLTDLTQFRTVFAEHPTLFILEEITEKAKKRTEKLLNFLDGETSWPYNFTFATTNYPGELPGNIVDRPGRFDRLVNIGNPNREQRKKYLRTHLESGRITPGLLDETEGFSLSYLRELAVQMKLYNRSVDSILERFQKKKHRIREAFRDPDEKVGFLQNTSSNGNP